MLKFAVESLTYLTFPQITPRTSLYMRDLFRAIGLSLCVAAASVLPPKAGAIIACPDACVVTQPDGSRLTLRLCGDENFSYNVSGDGWPVLFNAASGAWEYASLNPMGELVLTGEVAGDGRKAVAAPPGVRPSLRNDRTPAKAPAPYRALKTGQYDYSKFRGLIILVEYNDAPFSRDDIREVFDDMVNKRGYDGYLTTNLIPSKEVYTGSVRDYYYENSGGVFDPVFDVVGPVKIDYSQYSARKSANAQALVAAALKAADPDVDYSLYDTDGNRQVDMVYFIFSGAGSNFSGNDERLIWPHASTIMAAGLDGVSFGRYACSTEFYGAPAGKLLDGIGTICHEFSHVLGLPDLYDVDYETGGQSVHPARWSVMASGSYLNKSRTPCGYSLFERYALGFAVPKLITEPGNYSLKPLNEGDTPEGYRIDTPVDKEFFLIEARTCTRWDAYLPGEGMLVHRVDSTDAKVWENNKVNASSARNYYTLLRATPKKSGTTVTDSDGDPFPGSGSVTSLTNSTSPALRSWTMMSTPLVIENIAQGEDGSVSFSIAEDNVPTLVEDFQSVSPDDVGSAEFQGRFAVWTLSNKAALNYDAATDVYSLNTVKGSEVVCQPFGGDVENMQIAISNLGSSSAIFRLYTSTDGGATWRPVSSVEGTANPSVKGNTQATIHYNTGSLVNAAYRIVQFSGSTTVPCTVERVQFAVKASTPSGIEDVMTDFGAADEDGSEQWYDLMGRPVSVPTAPGIYLRRHSGKTEKIIIR